MKQLPKNTDLASIPKAPAMAMAKSRGLSLIKKIVKGAAFHDNRPYGRLEINRPKGQKEKTYVLQTLRKQNR